MRRFRARRRRIAALALLPLAALTTTTTITTAAETAQRQAEISSSAKRVAYGDRVTLRGSFPGAADAAVEIRHRARGATAWRLVARTRTDSRGRYRLRVKPRRTGQWRAALATATQPEAETEPTDPAARSAAVDPATPRERVVVRSRTRARASERHLVVGERIRIRGRVVPRGRGRRVVVKIGGDRVATRTKRNGSFKAAWRGRSTGRRKVTVRARGNRVAAASRDRAGRVTVYRRAAASWYGPGLYGNRTACGQTLTPSTLGVAHKTMPCGTRLRLRYRGRTVAVRVIDRGPYAGDREFDLTYATKRRLRFGSTGTVLSSR